MSRLTAIRSAVLAVVSGAALFGNNVFVVPTFTGSPTATVPIYSGNPLTLSGNFQGSTDTFAVFRKAALTPADTKYYFVSRNSVGSIVILNGALQPIGNAINLGQPVTAAGLSPDGKRLVVTAGNLRIFNTDNDQEVQIQQFIDTGGANANDLAFSQDSRLLFVVTSSFQRMSVISLYGQTLVNNYAIPGIQNPAYIAAGPNGMMYLSAENKVIEFDPFYRPASANAPVDSAAIRRTFNLDTRARIRKLQFTPDGTRAVAINDAPNNGGAMYFFNINLASANGSQSVLTQTALNGAAFSKLYVAGNNRAYAITTATSPNPEKLIDITMPPAPGGSEPIAIPEFKEAFFGSLGNVDLAESVALSDEYPNSLRMIVNAPLSRRAASAANRVYDMTLGGNPNRAAEISLTFLPNTVLFAGPAAANPGEAVTGVDILNENQPALNPGARSLPYAVKVLGSSTRPIPNLPVTISTGNAPGAQVEVASAAATNHDGLLYFNLIAPTTPGEYLFTVTPQNGPARSFRVSVLNPSGPGGGGNPGGGGGPQMQVVSGDGQVIADGNITAIPYVIQVLTAPGTPAANVEITWNVASGGTRWVDGASTDTLEKRVTITDANGTARNNLFATVVGSGSTFIASEMSATAKVGNVELVLPLFATSYRTITEQGNFAAFPTANLTPDTLAFRGRTGSTLTTAITAQIIAATGVELGRVMSNVGISVHPPLADANTPPPPADPARGPVAVCTPRAVALTGADGIGTCDIKLTGRAGTYFGVLNIGNYKYLPLSIVVEPGAPANLVIQGGDKQSVAPGDNLPLPLTVVLDDGGGTNLGNVTIRWEVIQGLAILANPATVTDSLGRSQNLVRIGNTSGEVLVRATAVGGTNPSVNFSATVRSVVGNLTKVSGDTQTTFTNTNFTNPVVVQVNDTQGRPVAGQAVTFTIAVGPATFTNGNTTQNVTTGADGRASATLRAGNAAGSVTVNASVPGTTQTVSFNLATQPPGPQVNSADFFNSASNERGFIAPGALFTVVGTGFASELRGCVEGRPVAGPWPTRVNNVEVLVGPVSAPILAVCNINNRETIQIQVPFETTPGVVNITIRSGSSQTVVNNVRVVDLQPGIFETTDAQGRRYATALKENNSLVTPENPARWGEVIRIFITGAGQTTPLAQTGIPGLANQRMQIEPVVGVNDAGARLVGANYVQGQIGQYEVQIQIPEGTPPGNRSVGVVLPRPGSGQFVFPENSPVIAISQ